LGYPDKMSDVPSDTKPLHDLATFRGKAKLRSKKEILDKTDLLLRMHWACEEARLNNKPMPGNLSLDVIMEWHLALNWLIRYGDQNWDDVTTDT
ncbi:MAG: DUF4272 domain-containing protein, partial [Bacteroidetes bacterium]|nr:DUF4272 domain-containing protein [Bacteroidota bacterium]